MSHIDALRKAKQSLGSAERSLSRLKSATQYLEIDDSWTSLLYALAQISRLHKILEGEFLLKPILKSIYDDMRGENPDPLISYIYEARNVKDHGLKPITSYVAGSISLGSKGGSFRARNIRIGTNTIGELTVTGNVNAVGAIGEGAEHTDIHIGEVDDPDNNLRLTRIATRVILEDLLDSKGKAYPVPTHHLGSAITSDLHTVASLAFHYYEDKFQQMLRALDLDDNLYPHK